MEDEEQNVLEDMLEALCDPKRNVMREQGLAFRLMKNGRAWDYTTFMVDVQRWMLKVLAEEPDAKVSIDVVGIEEWEAWRGI